MLLQIYNVLNDIDNILTIERYSIDIIDEYNDLVEIFNEMVNDINCNPVDIKALQCKVEHFYRAHCA